MNPPLIIDEGFYCEVAKGKSWDRRVRDHLVHDFGSTYLGEIL